MRIRELRIKSGYNQKEFAAILNVAPNTYNQWETGKREPDYEMLKKIADYFNVSVDYLLGREEAEKSPIGIKPTEDDVKVALFGGDEEVTEEMWNEVKSFVEFVKSKKNNENR